MSPGVTTLATPGTPGVEHGNSSPEAHNVNSSHSNEKRTGSYAKHVWSTISKTRSKSSRGSGRSMHSIASNDNLTKMYSQSMMKQAMLRQILLTLAAVVMIVAAFLAMGGNFVVTYVSTSGVLQRSGVEIRRRVARAVMDEASLTLRGSHGICMRLAEHHQARHGTGQRVWPVTPESIEHHLEELLAHDWVHNTRDVFLRRVDRNGTEKEFVPSLGNSINLAVQEDLRTPSTDLHNCAAVLQAGVFPAVGTGDGAVLLTDNPMQRAYGSIITEDSNGTRSAKVRWTVYDTELQRLVNVTLADLATTTCKEMPPMQQDWSGGVPFRWFGPVASDPYRSVEATAAIRNEEGSPIGYFSCGLSVVFSFNPVLNKILADGGDLTRGAELAIISESGLLLALSGTGTDSFLTFDQKYVTDIPAHTALGAAIGYLKSKAGEPCPAWHVGIDEGERVIDAIPVSILEYGLPAMDERWCVIQTYPRENIYEASDNAKKNSIIAGVAMFVLLVCAMLLFVASLAAAVRSERNQRADDLKEDTRQVTVAVRELHVLNCPMALVSAEDFLALPRMEHHESLRDRGALTVLDSVEAIAAFKEANLILFFSHQWLCFTHPDNSVAAQLEAMKSAVRSLTSAEKGLYVWCDYSSISQCHPRMQREAIASLPVYARMADKFIIVAPPAIHENLLVQCNLATYTKRGWCRAEMLAKACGSGIENMYTCTDNEGTLSPVTREDLSRLSLYVFQGTFTVPEDVETLVKPILGLYALVLEHSTLPHMRIIHSHIQSDKDRFFPESYHSEAAGAKIKLFGKCIGFLEMYIEAKMHGENASKLLDSAVRHARAKGLFGS